MFEYRKSSNVGNAPEIIQVDATNAEEYKVGEALVLSSGKATKAGATAIPEYICAEKKTAVTGDKLSVYFVEPNQEYETELSADGAVTPGVKYTIASDGLRMTATSTSGVAEVVQAFGTTSGSKVFVRFTK